MGSATGAVAPPVTVVVTANASGGDGARGGGASNACDHYHGGAFALPVAVAAPPVAVVAKR